MWRKKTELPPPVVVFDDLLRRCQDVRQAIRQLTAEVSALSLQLAQLESQLRGVQESPQLAAEEFTYDRRQRGA